MDARGFTLIELMITVAVIGILAAVAYPSYLSFMIRGNRSQAEQFLSDLAQRQERFRLDQGLYAKDLPTLVISLPPTVSRYYDSPDPTATPPTLFASTTAPAFFVAALTPKSGTTQAGDGRLFINSRGETWRDATSGCAISVCASSDSTATPWN